MASYSGLSGNYLNSPAARALAALTGPQAAVPSGGDETGQMRPGLSNALADATGEAQLQRVRELIDSNTPQLVGAQSTDVPNTRGGTTHLASDAFSYLPKDVDALDAEAHARSAQGLDTLSKFDTAASLEPMQEDLQDDQAHRDARRYFDPIVSAQRQQDYTNKLRLATQPAQVAANSRTDVATIGARAAMAAAQGRKPSAVETMMDYLDNVAKTYPVDPRTGQKQYPPDFEALRTRVIQAGGDALDTGGSTRDQPPAPSGPGMGGGPGPVTGARNMSNPAFEQQYRQQAAAAGLSPQEIDAFVAHAKGGGA